jgi:hypothetical protein
MQQNEKDKMIATFVALSPPFNGAPRSLQSSIGGNTQYEIIRGVGLHVSGQSAIIGTHGSVVDLLPGYSHLIYQNAAWMQKLVERIKAENQPPPPRFGRSYWKGFESDPKNFLRFFPTPEHTCVEDFTNRTSQCNMFMADLLNTHHLSILSQQIPHTYTNQIAALHRYSMMTRNIDAFFSLRNKSLVPWLNNPGVQIVIAYYSHLKTPYSYTFYNDPRQATSQGHYAEPNATEYLQGDFTVLTSSSLIAAVKWAWEYDNPSAMAGIGKAKPVKVAELCSSYNTKVNVYDQPGVFNKNEYVGVRCECMPKDIGTRASGDDCQHSVGQNDHGYHQFLGSVLNTLERSPNASFTRLREDELQRLTSECPQLRAPSSITSILVDDGGLNMQAFA